MILKPEKSSIFIMNNVKRGAILFVIRQIQLLFNFSLSLYLLELLVVRRLLQLRNRQIHFSASNYIVKIIEPNVVSRNSLHPRSLTTNVLPQTLDGKLNNVSMEQNADIRTINDSDLRIFLNDCVWNKMEDFGFNTLLNQRKQNKVGVISLECCHILMEAYAKKNDFQRISEVYDILREDGVVPQPQTYVYLLECLARLKSSDEVLTLAKKFIKNAEENVCVCI